MNLTTLLTHLRKELHNVKKRDFKGCNSVWKSALVTRKEGKWSTAETIDRKTDEEVEKLYNIYMQRQAASQG